MIYQATRQERRKNEMARKEEKWKQWTPQMMAVLTDQMRRRIMKTEYRKNVTPEAFRDEVPYRLRLWLALQVNRLNEALDRTDVSIFYKMTQEEILEWMKRALGWVQTKKRAWRD